MSVRPCGWSIFLRYCEGHCGGICTSLREMCFKKRRIVLPIAASLSCSSYIRALYRWGQTVVSWVFVSAPPVRATKMETSCQLQKHGVVSDESKRRWQHLAFLFNVHHKLVWTAKKQTNSLTSLAQYELMSAFLNLKYYFSDSVGNFLLLTSIFRTANIIIAFSFFSWLLYPFQGLEGGRL